MTNNKTVLNLKYYIFLVSLIACLFIHFIAYAENNDDKIAMLENFLAKLDNVSILFEQKGFDGKIDTGWMIIKKPNNIRIEYEKPNPIIIVSNKDYLILYNAKDDITTHLPIDNGPWSIFTNYNIKLSSNENDNISNGYVKEIEEINFNNKIHYFYKIIMHNNKEYLSNEIIVHASKEPYKINGWSIVTSENKELFVKIKKISSSKIKSDSDLKIFKISEKDKKTGDVWKGPFERLPAKRYPSERFN